MPDPGVAPHHSHPRTTETIILDYTHDWPEFDTKPTGCYQNAKLATTAKLYGFAVMLSILGSLIFLWREEVGVKSSREAIHIMHMIFFKLRLGTNWLELFSDRGGNLNNEDELKHFHYISSPLTIAIYRRFRGFRFRKLLSF